MDFDDLKMILFQRSLRTHQRLRLRAAVRLAQAFRASIEAFHVDIDPSLVLPLPAGVASR